MKRIKIILGIAVLALLLILTGCDAILESMFPEFADPDTYMISVDVEVPFSTSGFDTLPPLAGVLVPSGTQKTVLAANPSLIIKSDVDTNYDKYGTCIEGFLFFDDVAEGEYWVWVWVDLDKDGVCDSASEPTWQAFWWNWDAGYETFDFLVDSAQDFTDLWGYAYY